MLDIWVCTVSTFSGEYTTFCVKSNWL